MNGFNIIIVLGPTASGKTKLAAHLAAYFKSEIISADSRQVYRDMNIGTGKDYADYNVNGNAIYYHLIDVVEAGSHYDINCFTNDFKKVHKQLKERKIIPVLCGGSPLYIYALLRDLDFTSVPINANLRDELINIEHNELKKQFIAMPENSFNKLADLSTKKRTIRAIEIATYLNEKNELPPSQTLHLKPLIIGLNLSADQRRTRIAERLTNRFNEGMVEEVQQLLQKGIPADKLIFYGLEYKFITQHLLNELSYDEMKNKLAIAIQQFSKRQMTFYRKMEREGFQINWIDATLPFDEQLNQAIHLCETTVT